MLNYTLLHPPLLSALSSIGHGGRLLLADANFPLVTALDPSVQVIHLNLRPGMVSILDVLDPVLEAVDLEAATLMASPDGATVPAHQHYRERLGDTSVETVDRWTFYDRTRATDVALAVATGDQVLCSNLILTVGVRAA